MQNTFLKKLFLFDGLGALTSAFMLGIVLVKLHHLFGIPKNTLYLLAAIPCFFAVYDFYCYFKIDTNLNKYLKGIAFANLLYCLLSICLAIYHKQLITYLGWLYIIGEIIIVAALSIFELKAANGKISKLGFS